MWYRAFQRLEPRSSSQSDSTQGSAAARMAPRSPRTSLIANLAFLPALWVADGFATALVPALWGTVGASSRMPIGVAEQVAGGDRSAAGLRLRGSPRSGRRFALRSVGA